jgi:hypothetical protein
MTIGGEQEKAKIKWLRSAAQAGFGAIERGDFLSLRSDREIDSFIDRLGEGVSANQSAECHRD